MAPMRLSIFIGHTCLSSNDSTTVYMNFRFHTREVYKRKGPRGWETMAQKEQKVKVCLTCCSLCHQSVVVSSSIFSSSSSLSSTLLLYACMLQYQACIRIKLKTFTHGVGLLNALKRPALEGWNTLTMISVSNPPLSTVAIQSLKLSMTRKSWRYLSRHDRVSSVMLTIRASWHLRMFQHRVSSTPCHGLMNANTSRCRLNADVWPGSDPIYKAQSVQNLQNIVNIRLDTWSKHIVHFSAQFQL